MRDFRINGATMVKVKGGLHWNGQLAVLGSGDSSRAVELGLSSSPIRISPNFYRKNLKTDDFGPDASPDVQSTLANVTISMTLTHVDDGVLSLCIQDGLGMPGTGPTLLG